jgi:hypothetical protein
LRPSLASHARLVNTCKIIMYKVQTDHMHMILYFFEKAFVSLVNLLILILMVKFCRST